MEDLVRRIIGEPRLVKLIVAAGGLSVIMIVVRIFRHSLGRWVKDQDARYRVRKILSMTGYLASMFYLSIVFRHQLGGLTVALGVTGAGIAFALQEVIASVAGWVAVSVGGFYRVGDRVQLGGIRGDVIDVGVIRTTLMEVGQWVNGDLYSGRMVRIANSFIFKEPVFNYSGEFEFLWDEIVVPVRYGSDHQLARRILSDVVHEISGPVAEAARDRWRDLVKKYVIEDARVDPMVTLVANDNWLEFTVRYVVSYRMRRLTKDRLFSRILEEFEKTGNRVEMASATFELTATPPIEVTLPGARE